jgi:uncharacterized membrane-anchored protein
MEREILDFNDENVNPQKNRFLKYIGISRLILSAQIIFSLLQSINYYFTKDVDEQYSIDIGINYYFWGTGLMYILFAYYQVTQGINEINFKKLIYQNKGLKIFSLLVLSPLLFRYLRGLQRIELTNFNSILYIIMAIIVAAIWVQDLRYIFKRKNQIKL